MTRDAWHLRANVPTFVYLLAAVVVGGARAYVPDADWLIVHLLALGAASNAILVWSAHFAQTLLRLPSEVGRRSLVVRLVTLNVGIVLVLVDVILVGALLIGSPTTASRSPPPPSGELTPGRSRARGRQLTIRCRRD